MIMIICVRLLLNNSFYLSRRGPAGQSLAAKQQAAAAAVAGLLPTF